MRTRFLLLLAPLAALLACSDSSGTNDDDGFAEGIAGEECIDQLLRIRVHREQDVLRARSREGDRLVAGRSAWTVEPLEAQEQRLGHNEGERILAREGSAWLAFAFVARLFHGVVVEFVWRRRAHS